jgi:hypothetical protein
MTEQQHKAYTYFLHKGFVPVDKASYPLFKRYEGDTRLFDMTATVSIVWGPPRNAIYKNLLGYLCSLWFYPDGSAYFCVQHAGPVASLQQLIDTLYGLSHEAGLSVAINYIEERFLAAYQTVQGYDISSTYDDDLSEYAYRPQDILALSGKINANKRTGLNKFLAAPNVSILPISSKNIHICSELEKVWCSRQDCSLCESFGGCNKKVWEDMVDIFDDHIYGGIVGYIDTTPLGYVLWEKIHEKIVFVYFAKANIPHFNMYLYYRGTKMYLSEVEYINIGGDMGKEGLRTFKKHLGAHELWRKYQCTFTRTAEEKV